MNAYRPPRLARSGRSFDFAGYRVRLEAPHGDRGVEPVVAYMVDVLTRAANTDPEASIVVAFDDAVGDAQQRFLLRAFAGYMVRVTATGRTFDMQVTAASGADQGTLIGYVGTETIRVPFGDIMEVHVY